MRRPSQIHCIYLAPLSRRCRVFFFVDMLSHDNPKPRIPVYATHPTTRQTLDVSFLFEYLERRHGRPEPGHNAPDLHQLCMQESASHDELLYFHTTPEEERSYDDLQEANRHAVDAKVLWEELALSVSEAPAVSATARRSRP